MPAEMNDLSSWKGRDQPAADWIGLRRRQPEVS
jgi:hypothetical protein